MVRADLKSLPTFALPDGLSVAWHRPGDEAYWHRVQVAAERFLEIAPELFWQQFGVAVKNGGGRDSALYNLSERQCFLFDPQGDVVGTGTAWFDEIEAVRWGRVHWIAVAPKFQGLGLGKGLLAVICQRLCDLGHERAYLHTSAARIRAIKLYLKFGFEPAPRDAYERAVWKDILALLH